MRRFMCALVFAVSFAAAPAAFADCVDYSQARAKAEQDAARRTPLTAAQLGMPTLAGLERNIDMIGDPRCGGLTAQGSRARFKITGSFRDLITAIYPNIRRVTERDGMGREWYKNPLVGDDIILTSGTRLTFIGGREVNGEKTYSDVVITRTTPVGALSTDSQPYSVNDIVNWTPWVGGQRGNFVQVGGAAPATPATPPASNAARSTQPAPSTPSVSPCPPANTDARNAGAEIGGRVIGGGFGRDVGGALGGLFGGAQKQQPQQSGAPSGCPR